MGFKTLTKKLNEAKFVNSARGETDESESISQSLTDAQEKAELLNEARKIKRGKANLGANLGGAGAGVAGGVGGVAGANSNLGENSSAASGDFEPEDEILTRKIIGTGRKSGKSGGDLGANSSANSSANEANSNLGAGAGTNFGANFNGTNSNLSAQNTAQNDFTGQNFATHNAQNHAQNFAQTAPNSNLSAQNFTQTSPNSNLNAARNFAQSPAQNPAAHFAQIETLAEPAAKKRGLKRSKTILLYFSPEELESIKAQAENMYMNVNQYIRFKLFFGN